MHTAALVPHVPWMVAVGLVVFTIVWLAVAVLVPRQTAPEVLSIQPDMWAGGSADVWATWLDTDDDVQDLWAETGLPVRPGRSSPLTDRRSRSWTNSQVDGATPRPPGGSS